MLVGIETIDTTPVWYISIGKTLIVAPIVVATSSRNLNRKGKNLTQPMTSGVMNNTPKVAKNDNWKEISVIVLGL